MERERFEEVYISRRFFITTTTFLVLLIIGLGGLGYYFYYQYSRISQNPQLASAVASEQETQKLIQEVGQLIVLPANETPTIATVSDPSVLKSQPFFAQAEKGDRVLVYTQAGKAILYRPSTHKIIDVAPIALGSDQTQPQPQTGASQTTQTTSQTKATTTKKKQ